MKESGYQKKIIDSIEAIGGTAINGNFTIAGTADLICGYPHKNIWVGGDINGGTGTIDKIKPITLLHLHVEVKTQFDYERVFRSIKEVDGYYVFNECTKSLKKHEHLQITKLNIERKKGGLGLIAHSFEQVKEYMEGQ